MKDIVFFFGAGASYGAGDIIPERPPLGIHLYDELARIYPGSWGALPPEVQEEFRKNFEHGMAKVYGKYTHAIPLLMQQMAIYFIQFRPYSNSSLYCRLIQKLTENGIMDRVIFSTINYDCILEFALSNQGYVIDYFNISREGAIPVLKLHGSANMFCNNLQMSRSISYGRGVTFEGGIKAIGDIGTVVETCLSDTGLSPVMSLYMKGKPLQVSPNSVKEIQERWKEAVNSSDLVFCIGVNPNPEDDHIWGALGQTEADLCFIGDKEAFRIWCKKHRKENSIFLGEYFNTGFACILRRILSCEIKR